MKQLFLLSLFITVLSSCHEPYFENAFTEGEKIRRFPVEMQGEFLPINRAFDEDTFVIDTHEHNLLVSSRRAGFMTDGITDTISLMQADTDVGDIDSLELRLYKGIYYVSIPVYDKKTRKSYYKICQLKLTPMGMQYKYLMYDWQMEKLKTQLEFKEEIYTKEECLYGCAIGVFKHNHTDLYEFFEKEIPDSLSTLLVRVR